MKKLIWAGLLFGSLTLQGCGLDEVQIPESLSGPSALGIDLELLALPDVLTADGIQTAILRAVVRDQNGKPAAGKALVFSIADESGRTAEIGTLTTPGGARVFGSTTVTTNAQGIANVVYTTPERRDFTADAKIIIYARPVGTDANAAVDRFVRIELRSAEPRRFPQGGAGSPVCQFTRAPNNPVIEAGSTLRFHSTAYSEVGYIVRYEWYFGDGSGGFNGAEGHIDVQNNYPFAGTFLATHIVTDNFGATSICSESIVVR